MTSISAIIPSAGGPDLWTALSSIEAQSVAVDETIVVLNNMSWSRAEQLSAELSSAGFTPVIAESGGACEARDLGVSHASSAYVAFLDADDVWRADKIAATLPLLKRGSDVVSSRVQYNQTDGNPVAVAPVEVFEPGSVLGTWLFVNRRLSAKRNVFHTSTLVVRTQLAKQLSWVFGAPHEDWSFLLQAENLVGTERFAQLSKVLVDVSMGSGQSLSAGIGWRESWDWLEKHRDFLPRAAYNDFLAGQVMRYALTSPGGADSLKVFSEVARSAPDVSPRALALGATGILGRKRFEQLAVTTS